MKNLWFLLLWLSLMVPALTEIQTEFTKWPESVTAPVGDTVSFECVVKVPAERLAWRWKPVSNINREWKEVPEAKTKAPGVKNDTVFTKLTFTIESDTVTALYQCVAWYGAVILASVPGRLTIARMDLSKNTTVKSVIQAPTHNAVMLYCKPPLSDPPAVLNWWKEERGYKRQIDTPHGVLILRDVKVEDSGLYGCTASNELTGNVVELPEKTYLKVQHEEHASASFLQSDDYVGDVDGEGVLTKWVHANSALRLWCGCVGMPPPRVTWSRQGSRSLPVTARTDGQQLLVSPFTPEDEGIYSCSANGIRRSWKVILLQEAHWDGIATGVNVSEGGTARMTCGQPRGQPPPEVSWLLNAKTLTSGRGIITTESDLYIERAEKKHAGIVQCFACNTLGCSYDAALLTVVPVQISDQEYSGEGAKAYNFNVQPPKRHNKKNARKHKAVMVPPSQPNITRMSDESVMVTWSNGDHGLPIRFFKVQYREAINNSNIPWQTANQDISPFTRTYEVDGLIPNRYYKFRIAAVYSNQDNKLGKSSYKFYLQSYRGLSVPHAPLLTKAVAKSPKEILVNWTWSSSNGVACEGFYVYYRAVSSAGEYEKVTVKASARSVLLTNLIPDVAYEIKLLAYTVQSPSDFSAKLVAKTHRDPVEASNTTVETPLPEDVPRRSPGVLVTAGGALGAAALVVGVTITLLLCRRARRGPDNKAALERADNSANITNGYIQAKVPITITSNPMHNEGGDSSVEMSYLHNNNCGNTGSGDDTLPHSRKNGPSTRNYV